MKLEYTNSELEAHIKRLMQEGADALDFAMYFDPEPGEVERTLTANALAWAEHRAKKAIKPGLWNMLKYWVSR
jgi:hypothetical protein